MEVEEDAQPVSYLVWRAIDAAVIATVVGRHGMKTINKLYTTVLICQPEWWDYLQSPDGKNTLKLLGFSKKNKGRKENTDFSFPATLMRIPAIYRGEEDIPMPAPGGPILFPIPLQQVELPAAAVVGLAPVRPVGRPRSWTKEFIDQNKLNAVRKTDEVKQLMKMNAEKLFYNNIAMIQRVKAVEKSIYI